MWHRGRDLCHSVGPSAGRYDPAAASTAPCYHSSCLKKKQRQKEISLLAQVFLPSLCNTWLISQENTKERSVQGFFQKYTDKPKSGTIITGCNRMTHVIRKRLERPHLPEGKTCLLLSCYLAWNHTHTHRHITVVRKPVITFYKCYNCSIHHIIFSI